MSLAEFKALSCVIPNNPKQADKFIETLDKFRRDNPDLHFQVERFLQECLEESNFTVDEDGTVKFR